MEEASHQPATPEKPATPSPPVADPKPAAPTPAASAPVVAPAKPRSPLRPIIIGVVVVLALSIGVPKVWRSFNYTSTDDAYVNSYVTFVAPRVSGQVSKVLVDDNNRVKKGDVLVQLDPEPYEVMVAIKQAAVDAAKADLVAAEANVRGLVAQARSQRFALQHAMEDVSNQAALIRERVAKWEQAKATLVLAQQQLDRSSKLVTTKAVSAEEVESKQAGVNVAKAQVTQALEDVHQARVNLGLPPEPEAGRPLTEVPADLDQSFSSVRVALADLMHSASQLGIVPSSYNLTPKELLAEFYRRDKDGNIDRIYEEVMKDAPTLKQAQVAVQRTERDLDQAKLDLRYCSVLAEIDGVVTRRNVNPGNNVQAGQSLMAIRSLRDIWVDANFKETELRDLRIGQKVELETDLYGGKQIFEGRISGFTMGTGSTLALLPAQNATGNFVKVVQRLPVRIDIVNYDPDKTPLFVGLSVTPQVDLKSEPTGPNAGKFLQEPLPKPAQP